MIIKYIERIIIIKFRNKYLISIFHAFKYAIISLFCLFIINYYMINTFNNNKEDKSLVLTTDNDKNKTYLNFVRKSNIDFQDEFFKSREIKRQVYKNNLSFIETISGGSGNIGNALIMLNNLINICEKIKCKNIITPGGLENIIKKPIFYKDYNITIFPNSDKNKFKIDINIIYLNLFQVLMTYIFI